MISTLHGLSFCSGSTCYFHSYFIAQSQWICMVKTFINKTKKSVKILYKNKIYQILFCELSVQNHTAIFSFNQLLPNNLLVLLLCFCWSSIFILVFLFYSSSFYLIIYVLYYLIQYVLLTLVSHDIALVYRLLTFLLLIYTFNSIYFPLI